jgi:murein DD-endopeptidase MepM/ murein hydrolase activator NlpD
VNPLLIKKIFLIFSLKNELKYVLYTFIGILLLPVIAVLVVANTGIPAVSDKLASVNVDSHRVEIHDPSGKVIATIDATTIWPVSGVVTLEFGESNLPFQPIHTGIDIAHKTGDPITTFMKGKVLSVNHLSWGYGNYVVIDHGNNITSLYAHLSVITVDAGQDVQPGDVIGKEGSTGWSTGPHLHFEIRVFGVPVNPRTLVMSNP